MKDDPLALVFWLSSSQWVKPENRKHNIPCLYMVGVYLYINDVQKPVTYMHIVYLKSEWHTYLHRQVVLPRVFFFALIAGLLCSYFLFSFFFYYMYCFTLYA